MGVHRTFSQTPNPEGCSTHRCWPWYAPSIKICRGLAIQLAALPGCRHIPLSRCTADPTPHARPIPRAPGACLVPNKSHQSGGTPPRSVSGPAQERLRLPSKNGHLGMFNHRYRAPWAETNTAVGVSPRISKIPVIERAGREATAQAERHTKEAFDVLNSPLAGPGGLNALPAGIAKALESTRGENSGWRPPPQPGLHSRTAPCQWGPSFEG